MASEGLSGMVGKRFSRLLVIAVLFENGRTRLRCLCDCGNETTALVYNVTSGHKRSCGCLQREGLNARHGQSDSPTYSSWQSMLHRCYRPTEKGFANYGGRGVTVCDRWRRFDEFLTDMGARPDGTTLDRIDPNGNYEPGNCRWADRITQRRNRKNNVLSPSAVVEIVSHARAGTSNRAIAAMFSVDPRSIDKIMKGKSWSDVTGITPTDKLIGGGK